MSASGTNKKKILNDPVYGFISLPGALFFDIVEHRYFQRLRRIKQLGLTHLVYPGALHTRFHHAIGALHLMQQAIHILRSKGHSITEEEAEGVSLAILLHDIGHGPFSHALENSIVAGTHHEELSDLFMERLDSYTQGRLALAREIFSGDYAKGFLHQLVSSQLDMDRMDYLRRDSFFTGVSEGVISSERILQMLNVLDDRLVVDAKGIYSIEKFIVARRLMYWQVYHHKTVIGAEQLLIRILRRARECHAAGIDLFATPALARFLASNHTIRDFEDDDTLLDDFARLDDFDIFTSIKVWTSHPDPLLAMLSRRLVERRLLRTVICDKAPDEATIGELRDKACRRFSLRPDEGRYLVFSGEVNNSAYDPEGDHILILHRDGRATDIMDASEQISIPLLSHRISKHYLCYPKELDD